MLEYEFYLTNTFSYKERIVPMREKTNPYSGTFYTVWRENLLSLSKGKVFFYKLEANAKHYTKEKKETVNNHQNTLRCQILQNQQYTLPWSRKERDSEISQKSNFENWEL